MDPIENKRQSQYSQSNESEAIDRKDWIPFFKNEMDALLKKTVSNKRASVNQQNFQKLNILSQILLEKESELLHSASTNIRRINEINIDVIKSYIEELSQDITDVNVDEEDTFAYYPNYDEQDFNKSIYAKKEFFINKIPLMTDKMIASNLKKGFMKTASQKFVKNYISEYTPYNGLLLWHEVGVGKTCAGISIAENFRDFIYANERKILVLTPSETLVENWRDEIINIEKELKKRASKSNNNVQCTGNRYIREMLDFEKMNLDQLKRQSNRLINKYYEFMGYQKLANSIKRDLEKITIGKRHIQKTTIEYIKQRFSNRVIIMDEAHFTREGSAKGEGGENKDKIARPYLEMIARYAENTKIILATATPMYNITKEIVWLINLLLWNDKRAPIEEDELFDRNGIELKKNPDDSYPYQHSIEKLIHKTKGYVSYLRGENPFIFPVKLEPSDENVYTPNPKFSIESSSLVEIPDDQKIKSMKFYSDNISDWQYKYLKNFMNDAVDQGEEILEEMEETSNPKGKRFMTTQSSQASNIIFPISARDENGEFVGEIGENGFRNCFISNEKGKYEYNGHVMNIDGKPFLHLKNLGKYSSKFYNIIKNIQSCKGIVFAYSQYKTSGVRTLALALEENGFTRYVGNGKNDNLLQRDIVDKFCARHLKYYSELTNEEKKNFQPARYILLDGSMPKKTLNQLVREVRGDSGDPNTNGEFIKVILGSKVVEQGISFKRIREIHIIDPWHHLNSLEQAAGRGIRNYSHMELDPSLRNVTLFLHIASLPHTQIDNGIETPDERIYRKAFNKKKNMAVVERILKRNAIDCGLNRLGNTFLKENYLAVGDESLENRKIIDSKGRITFRDLYDNDYTMRCDFDKCDYKCIPDDIMDTPINTDTFNDFFAEDDIILVKEYIKNLFLDEYVYDEQDIIDSIQEMGVELSSDFIYKALDDIIQNRELVYDIYNRPGTVIDRYGKYIFQPADLTDENAPVMYRYLPSYPKVKSIDLHSQYPTNITIAQKKKLVIKKNITPKVSPIKQQMDLKDGSSIINEQQIRLTSKTSSMSKLLKELEVVVNTIQEYIEQFYSEYPTQFNPSEPLVPSQSMLMGYMFNSYIESQLSFKDRTNIILEVLENIIKSNYSSLVSKYIVDYYDTPKTNTYILRNRRDIFERSGLEADESVDNNIVGFHTYDPDQNYHLYIYNSDNQRFEKISLTGQKAYSNLIFDEKDLFPSDSGLYGYLEDKKGVVKFNIINKSDGTFNIRYNKDGSEQKKTDRTGAVCGTAKGAKDKPELVAVINILYGKEKYTVGSKDRIPIKTKTRSNNEKSLCEEIELLLRHNDQRNPKISKSNRYFYRIEEKILM
jgi:hypothetical protein